MRDELQYSPFQRVLRVRVSVGRIAEQATRQESSRVIPRAVAVQGRRLVAGAPHLVSCRLTQRQVPSASQILHHETTDLEQPAYPFRVTEGSCMRCTEQGQILLLQVQVLRTTRHYQRQGLNRLGTRAHETAKIGITDPRHQTTIRGHDRCRPEVPALRILTPKRASNDGEIVDHLAANIPGA